MNYLKAFSASILIHLAVFLTCFGALSLWKHAGLNAVDIDLSGSTLMLRPAKQQAKAQPALRPAEDWYMGRALKRLIQPVKVTKTAEPAAEPVLSCPPPCPQNPADWAQAASTSRRPVWVEGLITDEDYPKDARAQGREGRVRVEIFIDEEGYVRDVRIIQSSDERFTAVVREKLSRARFEPALDTSGRPVAVRMAVPIVFRLN